MSPHICRAPCSVGSLLLPCPLPLSSTCVLSLSQVNKTLRKNKKEKSCFASFQNKCKMQMLLTIFIVFGNFTLEILVSWPSSLISEHIVFVTTYFGIRSEYIFLNITENRNPNFVFFSLSLIFSDS